MTSSANVSRDVVRNCCKVNDTFRLPAFRVKDNGVWIIENVFKWLTGNLYGQFLSPGDSLHSSSRAARECVLQPLCVIFFLAESSKSDMSAVVNVRVLITRVCARSHACQT